MKDKILQIIPAPPGMKAVYRLENGELFHCPVICLALVEDVKEGYRMIQAFDFDRDGYFEDPCEASNFVKSTPLMESGKEMKSMSNDICPLLSVAASAAGGTFAECRREGCAWWDAAGLCCCLHIVADAVQQAADELVRASADKREAGQ